MRALVSGSVAVALLAGVGLVGFEISAKEPPEQARLEFQEVFEGWVSAMFFANQCGVLPFDDDKVSGISKAAGSVFYPGLRNVFKRSEYVSALQRRVPLAKLSRTGGFIVTDCSKAAAAATFARWPVEDALERSTVIEG